MMLTNKFTSPRDGCAEGGSFGLFRQGCPVILHRSRDATTNSDACKQVYKSNRCCAEGGSFGLFRQGCLVILHRSRDATTNSEACKQVYKSKMGFSTKISELNSFDWA
ncbi:MAG TPA: hypothetical protein PJ990_11445 [Saprospiraceae bacterium]|nr:hypothetical protein [Saprospiraceae bacterium]